MSHPLVSVTRSSPVAAASPRLARPATASSCPCAEVAAGASCWLRMQWSRRTVYFDSDNRSGLSHEPIQQSLNSEERRTF